MKNTRLSFTHYLAVGDSMSIDLYPYLDLNSDARVSAHLLAINFPSVPHLQINNQQRFVLYVEDDAVFSDS